LLLDNKIEKVGSGIDFAKFKLINILSKNCGYSTLKKMDSIINGDVKECDHDEELS